MTAPGVEIWTRVLSKRVVVASDTPIIWTQQHRYLWTGRRDDMPVGIIERGARFHFIDASGAEYHGFRTLEEAQDAATALAPELSR